MFCFHRLTFDLFSGFDVLCAPLERADQCAHVWQVHLTLNVILQILQTVLRFSARSGLKMMDLGFKCLWCSVVRIRFKRKYKKLMHEWMLLNLYVSQFLYDNCIVINMYGQMYMSAYVYLYYFICFNICVICIYVLSCNFMYFLQ